jgi:hypothetical protein
MVSIFRDLCPLHMIEMKALGVGLAVAVLVDTSAQSCPDGDWMESAGPEAVARIVDA